MAKNGDNMSYVLFFRTKEQEKSRYCFARICDTYKDAIASQQALLKCGYLNQEVVHTRIKEGRK